MTLDVVADLLACPRCGHATQVTRSTGADHGDTLDCASGHAFDIARQGYVNLSGAPPPKNADTAEMIAARAEFLGTGRYAGLADRIAETIPRANTIVDCGAGTGYYAADLLVRRPAARAVALDVSVAACRRAAQAHPRLGAVVADTWRRLPVADGVADAVLCVFAPRNPAEFCRLLAAGGRVVTVTPTGDHLAELRARLGLLAVEVDKQDRLTAVMAGPLQEVERIEHLVGQSWDRSTARAAVAMGPNAFHLSGAEIDRRVAGGDWPLQVTIGCTVRVWAHAG